MGSLGFAEGERTPDEPGIVGDDAIDADAKEFCGAGGVVDGVHPDLEAELMGDGDRIGIDEAVPDRGLGPEMSDFVEPGGAQEFLGVG